MTERHIHRWLRGKSFSSGRGCGGLRQDTLVFGNQAKVRKEAEDAIQQTSGQRFILGTGCVVPVIASHGNLVAADKVSGSEAGT